MPIDASWTRCLGESYHPHFPNPIGMIMGEAGLFQQSSPFAGPPDRLRRPSRQQTLPPCRTASDHMPLTRHVSITGPLLLSAEKIKYLP